MKTITLSGLRIAPDRQRDPSSPAMSPESIGELADSIEARGLLAPLVIEMKADGAIELRAGERRSKAISFLYSQGTQIRFGRDLVPLGEVPVVEFDELDEIEAFLVEQEENEKREPFTLTEKARSYAKLHSLLTSRGAEPREALVATRAAFEHLTPAEMDKRLKETGGLSGALNETHRLILVGQHLDNPEVAKAKTLEQATKIIRRTLRKEEDAKVTVTQNHFAHLGDALETLSSFPSNSFDGTVSDPPYGIGIEQMSYQTTEQKYDDSYQTWVPLMEGLAKEYARVLSPNSHGYLFCDISRFTELSSIFRDWGFETYPRPLIWDRSPDGRVTHAEKWPRHVYECVLFFQRGSRALLEVRGDVLRYSAEKDVDNYHGAKKPVELFVDLITRSFRPGEQIVDPFAGSFPTARAAKRTNVVAHVIEGDPAYFALGSRMLEKDDGEF
jgi:DNA modification methylase/ParB-like chromosome segregation protein Spo0J